MDNRPLVLIADDEPQITKLVAMTLTEEGFRVVTARNGEEALDRVASLRPDVVLLDIVMPGLDGIEVMHQLREWHPVPVIGRRPLRPPHGMLDTIQYAGQRCEPPLTSAVPVAGECR